MDILIESTKKFERDIKKLSKDEKEITIKKINDFVSLFPDQKSNGYRKLRRTHMLLGLNGYDSSLYTLKISQKLRVILNVYRDES